jgi:hypothetical protein
MRRFLDAVSTGNKTEAAIGTTGWVMTVHMKYLCTNAVGAQREK